LTTTSIVGHYSSGDDSGSLSSTTWFNSIVTTTQTPRRADGSWETGDIGAQADCTLENLKRTLDAVGSSMADVLHVTIYLTDMADWSGFNESYARHFPKPYPERCCVGVSALAIDGMRVEVTVIAARTAVDTD